MNTLKKIGRHLSSNLAEYYTLLIIVVAIPVTVGFMTNLLWGFLLSFALQAAIGVFYIKGMAK